MDKNVFRNDIVFEDIYGNEKEMYVYYHIF